MRQLRLAVIGFGTVGRWLSAAIDRRRAWLESECGVAVSIVGVATRRDGLIYRKDGLDVARLLEMASSGRPLAEYPGALRSDTGPDALAGIDADVLAEASNTNPREPEPALTHIRSALGRGVHVITSSKGACAAAAVDLAALARRNGIAFRMESTVMSGTPVLSTIGEGLAGSRITAVRGILNGTANHILTMMARGSDYAAALADARALGFAEPDASDDVDGHDVVAKARILAAVAFGETVTLDQVFRRGIAGIKTGAVRDACREGRMIRLVASVRPWLNGEGTGRGPAPLEVRVEPLALPPDDPLSRVDGVTNALTIETDTVRQVTIVGPGAGPEQAGQGMFADLVAVTRMK